MPEEQKQNPFRRIKMRYRGRFSQIQIYLGKLLRMFLYQSDWKVLPMSAMVAGLVGLVIRRRFFATMEGTLMSALAVTCLCLWNGCFNSIQVICRERDVIKREHRSGMHISSYIAAHMIYQALLCLLQTGITLYVMRAVGVRYPTEGLITRFFIVEFSISLFLITYAADMMSLWISALSRTTTAAMTIMPVVLIVQLVFSGGMMSLPERAEPITGVIISNYGLKLIATQANYNAQPLGSAWGTVERMKGNEIKTTLTMGQILDYLGDPANPQAEQIRSVKLTDDSSLLGAITVGTVVDTVNAGEEIQSFVFRTQRKPDQKIITHRMKGRTLIIGHQETAAAAAGHRHYFAGESSQPAADRPEGSIARFRIRRKIPGGPDADQVVFPAGLKEIAAARLHFGQERGLEPVSVDARSFQKGRVAADLIDKNQDRKPVVSGLLQDKSRNPVDVIAGLDRDRRDAALLQARDQTRIPAPVRKTVPCGDQQLTGLGAFRGIQDLHDIDPGDDVFHAKSAGNQPHPGKKIPGQNVTDCKSHTAHSYVKISFFRLY